MLDKIQGAFPEPVDPPPDNPPPDDPPPVCLPPELAGIQVTQGLCNIIASEGDDVTLNVQANSSDEIWYEWVYTNPSTGNDVVLEGTVSNQFTINNVNSNDAGLYRVVMWSFVFTSTSPGWRGTGGFASSSADLTVNIGP